MTIRCDNFRKGILCCFSYRCLVLFGKTGDVSIHVSINMLLIKKINGYGIIGIQFAATTYLLSHCALQILVSRWRTVFVIVENKNCAV